MEKQHEYTPFYSGGYKKSYDLNKRKIIQENNLKVVIVLTFTQLLSTYDKYLSCLKMLQWSTHDKLSVISIMSDAKFNWAKPLIMYN